MSTSAEFGREVSHFYYSHHFSVFFAEQRRCADFFRFREGHFLDSDRHALKNGVVDEILDLPEFLRRRGREMGEVKTQPVGFHQGAGLLDMVAKNRSQRFM